MTDYKALQEDLKAMNEAAVIELVRKRLEEKLPDGKTIESSTDEELGQALDELKATVKEDGESGGD